MSSEIPEDYSISCQNEEDAGGDLVSSLLSFLSLECLLSDLFALFQTLSYYEQ